MTLQKKMHVRAEGYTIFFKIYFVFISTRDVIRFPDGKYSTLFHDMQKILLSYFSRIITLIKIQYYSFNLIKNNSFELYWVYNWMILAAWFNFILSFQNPISHSFYFLFFFRIVHSSTLSITYRILDGLILWIRYSNNNNNRKKAGIYLFKVFLLLIFLFLYKWIKV